MTRFVATLAMLAFIFVTGLSVAGHTAWAPGAGGLIHSMGDDNAGAH